MNFPLTFKCPHCGSNETVSQAACAEEKASGKLPLEAFTSINKMITPLTDSRAPTGLSVPLLICHQDVCLRCGTIYCTKAEKTQAVVGIREMPHGRGGQPPMSPMFGTS